MSDGIVELHLLSCKQPEELQSLINKQSMR